MPRRSTSYPHVAVWLRFPISDGGRTAEAWLGEQTGLTDCVPERHAGRVPERHGSAVPRAPERFAVEWQLPAPRLRDS